MDEGRVRLGLRVRSVMQRVRVPGKLFRSGSPLPVSALVDCDARIRRESLESKEMLLLKYREVTAFGVLGWMTMAALAGPCQYSVSGERQRLAFQAGERTGLFKFDTGELWGVLRLDGKRAGIERLVHVGSGLEVTYGGGHVGLLSPYRVFSTGRRYGRAARDWPCQPRLLPNGGIEVRYPPADNHPLSLTMRFRWSAQNTLDLEVGVKPLQDMPDFELFMSSYFAKGFAAAVYLQPNRYEPGAKPRFMSIDYHPLFAGNYMIFPRDRVAARIVLDGRWEIAPNPVQWCITRWLAAPIATRRHAASGLVAVLMARPEECFAIATPYERDPPDGVAGHRSLYFCLFGRGLKAGEMAHAHMRLIVATSMSNEQIVRHYQAFLGCEWEVGGPRRSSEAAADRRRICRVAGSRATGAGSILWRENAWYDRWGSLRTGSWDRPMQPTQSRGKSMW